MNPPQSLWPEFSGPCSQLAFYVGLAVTIIMRGGDVGMSRPRLFALLPKHVPSLAYYYEQARSVLSNMRWLTRANAKILWKTLCRDPRLARRGWGNRNVLYYSGIHGRFDSPADLAAFLRSESLSGRCGVDRSALEGSSTVYTVRENKTVNTFNNFRQLSKHYGMSPHELSGVFSQCLSDSIFSFMYQGKVVSWMSSVQKHIEALVLHRQAEVLRRADGSEVVVSCQTLALAPISRSSVV